MRTRSGSAPTSSTSSRTPPHAAVGETVEVAPKAARGLVNAVLRRVASAPPAWPDDATRLSYPDWVVDTVVEDLGRTTASRALEVMNDRAAVTEREDGYVQDLASQWVAAAVGRATRGPRGRPLRGPGGKALLLAATGATVVAADIRRSRAGLMAANAAGRADAAGDRRRRRRARHCAPASFDRVLVDAPCSGLGVLRRRPDARWRIDADAPDAPRRRCSAPSSSRGGAGAARGRLVYSVCTLTDAESVAVDEHLADRADFTAEPPARRAVATARPRRGRCCPRTPTPTACTCCGSAARLSRSIGPCPDSAAWRCWRR